VVGGTVRLVPDGRHPTAWVRVAAYVFTGSGRTWSQNTDLSDPTEDAANENSPAGCNGFSNPCNALERVRLRGGAWSAPLSWCRPRTTRRAIHPAPVGAAFVLPKVVVLGRARNRSRRSRATASPEMSSARAGSFAIGTPLSASPRPMRPGARTTGACTSSTDADWQATAGPVRNLGPALLAPEGHGHWRCLVWQ